MHHLFKLATVDIEIMMSQNVLLATEHAWVQVAVHAELAMAILASSVFNDYYGGNIPSKLCLCD